jgi:hypothetical protein
MSRIDTVYLSFGLRMSVPVPHMGCPAAHVSQCCDLIVAEWDDDKIARPAAGGVSARASNARPA